MAHRTVITTLAGLGLALLYSAAAVGFQFLKCDGNPIKWSQPFGTTQNLCSIPVGSSQSGAYVNAINRWNAIPGMFDMVFHSNAWPAGHCTVTVGDEWNDVALVDTSDIDGAAGRTFWESDCEELEKVDILIANLDSQSFTNPDEAFGSDPFQPLNTGFDAFVHEFGHAHGLAIATENTGDNHPMNFSIMRPTAPAPHGGGGAGVAHSRPMPDDAAGGRFLYPSGKSEVNVFASAQRLLSSPNSIVETAAFGTVNKCRGDAVSFQWTTANRGTVPVTSDQRFYMAKSPTAHSQSGVTMATWFGATVNAEKRVSVPISVNVPCGTPAGLYWVYHAADAGNKVAESVESDNVVHNAMTIQVLNCGC
jgi:hypothetical protein